jgi:hypothetical protein|tara:strand:+ start:479 stop:733 length:255 start_codon:yes stop_codon:yes gene_type:complete
MKKTVLKVLCGVMILMGTACTNTTQEELSDVYMTINTRPAGTEFGTGVKYSKDSIRLTKTQVEYFLTDSVEGYLFMEFNKNKKQ